MNSQHKITAVFVLLGAFFFIPFLGGVHLFDWDEVNFAEISREMIALDDYLRVHVNYQPFWEKPPFFFWLQAVSMGLFDSVEFAARFPNAVCGILTLAVLFNIGKKLYNIQFGVIWATAYLGSILPFLYFKSGIIDPWFNLFIFLGMYYFILFYWKKEKLPGIQTERKWQHLFLAGLFTGMGILTKGPVAYLIIVLAMGVYWAFKKFRLYINPWHFLFFTLASSLTMLTWYGLEYIKHGPWFIVEFNKYQFRLFSTPDAGHAGFPGYHFVVLAVGVFPASVFAIRSFFKMPAEEKPWQQDFKLWMSILFWVVLILFTIVKSKIVHYSSMCYFPMTFLAALVIHKIMERKIVLPKGVLIGLWFIGGLYALATFAVPLVGMNIDLLKPFLQKDPFAVANLEAEVDWSLWQSLPGVWLLAVMGFTTIFLKRERFEKGFLTLFGGVAVFVMLTLVCLINNIEAYSQRAAIGFFKSKAGEDCYVITHGYKSYGQLLYTQKPPVENPASYDKNWLLHGEVDKPVYVVTKVHKTKELDENPNLERIGEKNGFVFYKREKHYDRN